MSPPSVLPDIARGEIGLHRHWSLATSLAFHILLLATLFLLPKTPQPRLPPEEAIVVEMVASPPEPAPPVQELAVPEKSPTPPEAPAQAPAAAPSMIRATNLFSAKLLADPRNRQAREGLAQLAGSDRMEQLCNAEAMEQIHHWRKDFDPDRLVAYAMGDTRIDGDMFIADRAAFRSKHQWYNVKFRCGLTSDFKTVASFEFEIGDAIPRAEWEGHNLAPVH